MFISLAFIVIIIFYLKMYFKNYKTSGEIQLRVKKFKVLLFSKTLKMTHISWAR